MPILRCGVKIEGAATRQGTKLSSRSTQVLVAVGAALVLLLLPWRVLHYGYLPDDDALRHAAKAISGKPWGEILLLRPEITIDHNPGWHWILSAVHNATGWNARQLVLFSVLSMFAAFGVAPLFFLRRPEAWLASLAASTLVFPYLAERALLGRPLLLTVGITLVLLCLWARKEQPRNGVWAVTVLLIALSTWVHGSWYLLLLLPVSFALARHWKSAVQMTACWIVGSLFGALLTGQPWTFLRQSALIPFLAFGQNVPAEMLVGEFVPFQGSYPAGIIVSLLLLARRMAGRPVAEAFRDPILWLAVLGGILGFRVARFWLDWGLPAFVLWVAREIDGWLPLIKQTAARLALGGVAAILLVVYVGSDQGQRWSQYGRFTCLNMGNPDEAAWLPASGGVLYSVDMSAFYHTFFCNPRGEWKYALGFEPTFMRPENFAVYEELILSRNAARACAPWVARMTANDRLMLRGPAQVRPAIPELEWRYFPSDWWVGKHI